MFPYMETEMKTRGHSHLKTNLSQIISGAGGASAESVSRWRVTDRGVRNDRKQSDNRYHVCMISMIIRYVCTPKCVKSFERGAQRQGKRSQKFSRERSISFCLWVRSHLLFLRFSAFFSETARKNLTKFNESGIL